MTQKLFGATVATLALAVAVGAHAQHRTSSSARSSSAATSTAAPTISSAPLNHGAPIAGMCIYSNSRVIEESTVGKAFQARMQQLRSQAAAELSGQQTQLQNDEKVLAGKRATLNEQQFTQQAQPLAQREQALNATAEQRSRELQATYVHQLQRLGAAIEPLVRTAYEGHHCSVLLNGDTVMAANPSMDLSKEVENGLNSKMTTITFDREAAPAQ
jgi:Skp family chaperone for outer membrane proteins